MSILTKSKPKTGPIDLGSKAGRQAAWSEVKSILERELTGKPVATDGDRLSALCNALEISDARLTEFKGALALHAKCEVEFEVSMRTRGECRSDKLRAEFEKGTKSFAELVAKREALKDQIREAESAEVAAIHTSENSRQTMNAVEGSWPALFRGQELPDRPSPLLRQEALNAIGQRFNAMGERVK